MELGGPLDVQQPAKTRRPGFHRARLHRRAGVSVARRRDRHRPGTVAGGSFPVGTIGRASRASPAPWPQSPWLNTRPEVKYVGDAVCARCHADIAETYRRHPMGRSLVSDRLRSGGRFRSAGRDDDVRRRPLACSRSTGATDARSTAKPSATGLGCWRRSRPRSRTPWGRGRGVSRTWSSTTADCSCRPSPGTPRSSNGTSRRATRRAASISTGRSIPIACSAIPTASSPSPSPSNRYEDPIFLGHAIGCERCHGPGELHAQAPGALGRPRPDDRQPAAPRPRPPR